MITLYRYLDNEVNIKIQVPGPQAAEDAIAEMRKMDEEFYGKRHNDHIVYSYTRIAR